VGVRLDGEATFGDAGGGVEAEGAGALVVLSDEETEGEEEAGLDGGTGLSEAREGGPVGLDSAGVDAKGEEGTGFEEAEAPGVADACWPAEEAEVVNGAADSVGFFIWDGEISECGGALSAGSGG